MIIPENFLLTSGCFKCNTSCVQALGWLEKKEEKKWTTILSFNRFRLPTYYCCCIDWTNLYKLLWLLALICSTTNWCLNVNTLIGATIVFSGHFYIWAMLYHQAVISRSCTTIFILLCLVPQFLSYCLSRQSPEAYGSHVFVCVYVCLSHTFLYNS